MILIFENYWGGGGVTGWGKNGPAHSFPGEKLTGGKFQPVTPVTGNSIIQPDR